MTDTSVSLVWQSPTEGTNATDYVVYYKKVDQTSMHETVMKYDNVSIMNFGISVRMTFHCEWQYMACIRISANQHHGHILHFDEFDALLHVQNLRCVKK